MGDCYAGRNLHFGVREHAMASMSRMALHGGVIPFCATSSFADYMRLVIRLASIMQVHSIRLHARRIGVGEDGPTHQPVEQAASLRAIPKPTVIRRPTPTRRRARGVAMQKKGQCAVADAAGDPGARGHGRRGLRRLLLSDPEGKPTSS